jgi:type I restriction enzyme, S subunit
VRAGWQSAPFESCIKNVKYTPKIQRKDFLDEGQYPIISQEENFINGYWNEQADLFCVSRPVVLFGDHTKIFKYVDFDFVLGADGVKLLVPEKFLLPKFFYYQLQTANLEKLGYARHYRLLKELAIAYPSTSEQQRIVAILDEAFDGIATAKANAEKNLQNARALFESRRRFIFTNCSDEWQEKKLEDVVDSKCSLSYGIVQPGDEYLDGLPIVRPTDLTKKIIEIEGLKRIAPNLADSYRRTTLYGGDILLCVRGATGTVSVAATELAGANVTRGIVPILFEPSLVSQNFGYHLMRCEPVQSQIREKTYGAALMQINIRDLRLLKLRLPSVVQQSLLAAELDELSYETQHLESLYQQKLVALDALKKSLLHQAFSGEL